MQQLIGTGGWEHESYDSSLYGRRAVSAEDRLALYARVFDAVEVRSTFWDATITRADARRWVDAVSGNRAFLFSVKLHSSYTHAREIRRGLSLTVAGLLEELARDGRLGALLLQFPFSFTNTSGSRYHLARIAELFRGFPLFAELRHSSWSQHGLIGFLRENGLSPVSSDFPRIRGFMPFTSGVTGETAYLRLHGRNERGWLVNGMDTRYDYLYNGREIVELRRRVETLSAKARRVIVIFNNTTGAKAIGNALELTSALRGGKTLSIPEDTLRAFPSLRRIASPSTGMESLFDAEEYREAM